MTKMLSGMGSFAQGLWLSRSPGSRGRHRDVDLEVFVEANVTHVICLQEEHEFSRFEPPETVEDRRRAVSGLGMRFTHEPIEDFEAPALEQAVRLVDSIREELAAGERIVVHCMAGLGRAGTIAACVLVAEGLSAVDAIATVRFFRFGAVQSESQEELVAAYEREVRG